MSKKKNFPAACGGSVQTTHWAPFCSGLPVGLGVFLVHDPFPKLREVMDCCSRSLWAFFWGQVGLSGCVKWFIRQARADVQQATQIVSCQFCFDEDSQTSGWAEGRGGGEKVKGGKAEADYLSNLKAFASDVDTSQGVEQHNPGK